MRIKINIFLVLGLFLIADIILFGLIFFLARSSNDKKISDIDLTSKISYIPFLAKDVEALSVNSKAFIIYDPNSRSVIAGNNEFLRFAPASSVKIMTASIILEEYPLSKIWQANGISSVVGSKMNLIEGELITTENLLYGLLLPSGNDAAYVFASEYLDGYAGFVNSMNNKAIDLKLDNTFFVDPSGFDDRNYTTAFDLARLAAYAMQNDKFREIVSTSEKSVTDITGNVNHKLSNLNELLVLENVIGIKTGFTEEAGGVLVTAVKNNNKTYIIVVLNSPDRFQDTRAILKEAIENIQLVAY
jgi:serine-type D-Ala-D-Ala carboxypeptidase (penicillin-binding protein 5/6)